MFINFEAKWINTSNFEELLVMKVVIELSSWKIDEKNIVINWENNFHFSKID